MAYVTIAEWRQYRESLSGAVQTAFTAQEDGVLQTFLDQAQAEIEAQTGKTFEAVNATRYYRAGDIAWNNGRVLLLDAWLLSVTSITNGDGVVLSAGDYWLLPRAGAPFNAIELKSSQSWRFATDGEIAIAGAWGFMQTPDERVKRVTMRLAEFFYQKRATTGESQVIGEGQIVVAAQYPKDVQDFITSERRRVPA
jgi:hypothetical protein